MNTPSDGMPGTCIEIVDYWIQTYIAPNYRNLKLTATIYICILPK